MVLISWTYNSDAIGADPGSNPQKIVFHVLDVLEYEPDADMIFNYLMVSALASATDLIERNGMKPTGGICYDHTIDSSIQDYSEFFLGGLFRISDNFRFSQPLPSLRSSFCHGLLLYEKKWRCMYISFLDLMSVQIGHVFTMSSNRLIFYVVPVVTFNVVVFHLYAPASSCSFAASFKENPLICII